MSISRYIDLLLTVGWVLQAWSPEVSTKLTKRLLRQTQSDARRDGYKNKPGTAAITSTFRVIHTPTSPDGGSKDPQRLLKFPRWEFRIQKFNLIIGIQIINECLRR